MKRSFAILFFIFALVAAGTTSSTAATTASTNSPFGVACSTGSSWYPGQWVDQVRAAGVANVRGFDQNPSNTSNFDTIRDANISVSGILITGGSFPWNDLDRWRQYIDTQVAAYPGVTHWEVWNEPPNFSADTDPAHYATIVAAAYDEVKRINPALQVGIAGKATDIAWLGRAISAGALGHFDYLTLHPYERTGLLEAGHEAQFMAIVPQVRAMLAATGSAQVPVRFTELGLASDGSDAEADAQADALVKAYTMSFVSGVEQVDWFEPWDGDNSAFGLIDRNGAPRPAFTALKTLIAQVGPDPVPLGWYTNVNGVVAMVFQQADRVVLAAWSTSSTTLSFTQKAALIDPGTGQSDTVNQVTLDRSAKLISLRGTDAANWRGKARWTAQYGNAWGATTTTAAKAWKYRVSATPGLYQGVDVLTDLPVDSDAGMPAWHVQNTDYASVRLAVSPQFAAYTGRTVKVTAVLRGDSGANAGFNIGYDSTNAYPGMTSRGWFHVAPESWQTYTWTIPEFAPTGAYGYNLALRSDGPEYQNYRIASITLSAVN